MDNEKALASGKRLVNRLMFTAVAMVVFAGVLLVCAMVMPIKPNKYTIAEKITGHLELPTEIPTNIQSLLVKIASRRLIMPSQVKAAVKDTGVARKLLEKLKLRGVVQIGADQVAYIRVEKKTTRKVREGEKLLSFVVKKIESGKVVLSLEGVEVVLRH
jgi:hypothetical protein